MVANEFIKKIRAGTSAAFPRPTCCEHTDGFPGAFYIQKHADAVSCPSMPLEQEFADRETPLSGPDRAAVTLSLISKNNAIAQS